MTNKEMFALAAECGRRLKAAGQANHVTKAKQIIYDTIRPILTNHIDTRINQNVEPAALVSDVELRARLKALLIERLNDRTLSASDIAQLKDVFGLADAKSELTINITKYSGLCSECHHTFKVADCSASGGESGSDPRPDPTHP